MYRGSWIIFNESKRKAPDVLKCGVNCHPSVGIEALFGREKEDLCNCVNHPMLLVPTEGDPSCVGAESALVREGKAEVIDCTDQKHGFVSQGDVDNDEKVEKDVQMVMEKSLEFFSKY